MSQAEQAQGFSSTVVLPGEIPNEVKRSTVKINIKRPPLVIRRQPMSIKRPPSSSNNKPDWMRRPSLSSNCIPNFEYLAIIDGILIEQDVTCGKENVRYIIKNKLGERIYYTKETFCKNLGRESDKIFGPGTITNVYDQYDEEVMKFFRPNKDFACCWCAGDLCDSCTNSILVEASGQILGTVRQKKKLLEKLSLDSWTR